ncbi:uncharacterized protein LOC109533542 [Dendroctonus ponderosae]|uniref:Uncharacterized protein n=1 Tax=Dendroctonus ponderosae TaxID=77166 RepID=A0AAR5NZT1_DENPD|nr:uncharacterized protein LOC109533542 [Dendroctonus ponderosae]KAH0999488.1 hypothetical protein HUJ04_005265 [Dendroctonus ponderosae]KAH1026663.1 hypothetical protein HUJ05_000296 [Dendroctonus ponderosae]
MENHDICKIIVLESSKGRQIQAKQQGNFLDRLSRHKKSVSIRKCLFGQADPEDTRRLLDDQYQLDQKRFLSKFGFDVETIEYLERSKNDESVNRENDRNGQNREAKVLSGKANSLSRKILKARRKVMFSKDQAGQSQQFITDFYYSKKGSALEKKFGTLQQPNNAQCSKENC